MPRFLPYLGASMTLLLSSCATIHRQQSVLSSSYVGKHQSAMVARYGHPLVLEDRGELIWDARGVSSSPTLSTNQVAGTVGTTPFSASVVTAGSPLVIGTSCTMRAWVDEARVVTRVTLEGDAGACKVFSRG